ncbi:MAG: response regulator [Bacteroidota bacterium]
MKIPSKKIVIADDDYDDIELFQTALMEICPDHELTIAQDGISLLEILTNIERPYAIVLDLNMPGKSGKQCLKEIRSRKELEGVPIIILSTSSFQGDIQYCLAEGATQYLVKPTSFPALKKIAYNICNGKLLSN